jgi:putative nucleotidyltransferase with HDIG domain
MSDSFTEARSLVGGGDGRGIDGTDEARELNQLAATLSQHLFSASRTVHLHTLDNRASQNVLARLREILEQLHEVDGRAALRVSTDLLMINDQRVVVDSQSMGPVVYLVDEMKRRKVEEIDFAPGVPAQVLGRFLQVFFADASGDDVFGAVRQAMTDAGIEGIKVVEWVERPKRLRDSSVGKKEIREESNKLYNRAVLFTGEVLRNIEQQRAIPIPKALRLTQQIVDIIQVDESILVGLASIKSHDEYTFAHSANVAVLSMLIADRIGMPRADVARVGLAALVHDIGKTHVPREVLNKETPLTDDEWSVMKEHTVFGALELSRSKALRAVSDSIFVAFQHHVRFDGDGYPQKPGRWRLIPMSRIVTVADYFDAMTTPRVYKKEPMTPDRALRFILDHSGVIFDPFIAKTFIQVMGLYPVGTVVELTDGRLAVVSHQNAKTSLMHRPIVSLIPDGDVIDLAESDLDGNYALSVVRAVYDPDAEVQKAGRFVIR